MSVAGPQSHDSPARLPGKGSPRTGNAPGAAAGGVFAFAGGNDVSPTRPPSSGRAHAQPQLAYGRVNRPSALSACDDSVAVR